MNTRNINYSLKNIPVPSQSAYLKCLVDKVESFVKRLRWRVFWYERKLQASENDNQPPRNPAPEEEQIFNNYGFKSPKTPPANQHLREFKADLFKIINELEFD